MLNILAYIVIPIYTILFAHNTNWLTTNFSVISGLANRKNAFLLWGVLVGIYFYYSLMKIIHMLPDSKKETYLLRTACLLLALAVTTPYLPDKLPLQAFLHVIFAFTASVLLMLCLYLIIWKLYRTNRPYYQSYVTGIVAITAISALLLLAAGIVSSALEIFFTISCVTLVRDLHKRVLSCRLTR